MGSKSIIERNAPEISKIQSKFHDFVSIIEVAKKNDQSCKALTARDPPTTFLGGFVPKCPTTLPDVEFLASIPSARLHAGHTSFTMAMAGQNRQWLPTLDRVSLKPLEQVEKLK